LPAALAARHYRGYARGHGHCLRFDKTTGALGGHALSKDGRKHCR